MQTDPETLSAINHAPFNPGRANQSGPHFLLPNIPAGGSRTRNSSARQELALRKYPNVKIPTNEKT
jgi:hypothetical protein